MFSLSDCINWDTNENGDCAGRVEIVTIDSHTAIMCETCRNRMPIKNEPVLFQGERYRVRHVLSERDIVIQDIEGNQLTVHPLTVQRGW